MSWLLKGRWLLPLLVVTQIAVFDSGCGTWLGNPKEPDEDSGQKSMVDLKFQGVTSANLMATSITVTDAEGNEIGALSIDTATVALKEIKLRQETAALGLKGSDDEESESESSTEFDFEGPYLVDLLTNSVTPDPEEQQIAAGSYNRIKLKLAKLEEEDAADVGVGSSDPIFERSIYVAGTYQPTSGDSKSFVMTFDLDEEFEIREDQGIELSADADEIILISFSLRDWFNFGNDETNPDGVDFSQVSDSTILLDEDAEDILDDLRDVIKENIKESAESGKDDDDDGEFDD